MPSPSKVYFVPEFFEQMKKMLHVTNTPPSIRNDFSVMEILLSNAENSVLANFKLSVYNHYNAVKVEIYYWSDGIEPQSLAYSVCPIAPNSFLYSSTDVKRIADEVFSCVAEREPRVVKNALSVFLEGLS